MSFEEYIKKMSAAADTVDNITNDNGEIDGDTIDGIQSSQVVDLEDAIVEAAVIKDLETEMLTVTGKMTAVEGEFGILKANVAEFEEITTGNLEALKAQIGDLNVEDLEAIWADIHNLETDSANIKHILAGNITSENIQAGAITAGSGIIADGAIGDAQISNLSANKLKAGTIDTSLVTITGKDGVVEITGNQVLVHDTTDAKNPVSRVVLGKYQQGEGKTEYGLLVRAKDGNTVMMDGNGVHNAGITDGAIDNNKISDQANIDGKKLDIASVVQTINAGETKIESTVVQVGNQSLEVYLGTQSQMLEEQRQELSDQSVTLEQHAETLKTQESRIDANEQAISLKVDTQTYEKNQTTLHQTISDNLDTARQYAEDQASSAKAEAVFQATVQAAEDAEEKAGHALVQANTYTEKQIENVNTNLSKTTASVEVLKEQIASKVEKTDVEEVVKSIQIGGKNIF